MTLHDFILTGNDRPSCIGSGLIALDVVFNRAAPDNYIVRSGGSCGNVMSILSYLGWKTLPVAKLGQDDAAAIVLEDLIRFGVDTKFISRDSNVNTPLVLEGIRNTKDGSGKHSFTLTCPNCGRYLLRYRAISSDMTEQVLKDEGQAQVFYFDRISRGILNLAKHHRNAGSLIVFEPSGLKNLKLFKEALSLAHILKYSRQRLPDLSGRLGDDSVPLEVQT